MSKRSPHKNLLTTAVAMALSVSFAVMGIIIAIATVQNEDVPVPKTESAQQQSQPDMDNLAVCGQVGGSCTQSEISLHNKANDCWVIYKNNYYNITSYVAKHPGGKSVFTDDTCGKDIESFLIGTADVKGQINSHGAGAFSQLESFIIGPVTRQ